MEVVGFYFSDHPLKHYPQKFFNLLKISSFNDIDFNHNSKKLRLCGSVLDIKERSNKDGRKYAFITVSEINSQYELSIFSENLNKFRYLLKEGNLLIFDIDIIINNNDPRLVIRTIKKLENEFNSLEKKIDIFIDPIQLLKYKDSLLSSGNSAKSKISIFINIDEKLVNFSSNKKYILKSFKQLDHLKNSKKLDYNLDIS